LAIPLHNLLPAFTPRVGLANLLLSNTACIVCQRMTFQRSCDPAAPVCLLL